jgi:hypothetical protein
MIVLILNWFLIFEMSGELDFDSVALGKVAQVSLCPAKKHFSKAIAVYMGRKNIICAEFCADY